MPRSQIVIINTRASNLHSVSKALHRAGADAVITSDAEEIAAAAGAVLPGVGASDAVMRALNNQGLTQPVRDFAASGKPLLCICLGMQVLFERSEEGELPGLGILEGDVRLIPSGLTDEQGTRLKVPHIGWNAVSFSATDGDRHPVFRGIPEGAHFYFVHSYRCVPRSQSDIAAVAQYGVEVCAAVARENIAGTQFHPEKSGDLGLQVYRNFIDHVLK